MEAKRKQHLALIALFLSFFVAARGRAGDDDYHNHAKLFVFGDSYADTGNNARVLSESWRTPYGHSWPHKPDGRWSDGFVLTDYIAKYLGLRTPVAFRSWKNHGPKKLKYGMNFAYGGTGVFDTDAPYPNMTMQINFFEQLVKKGVYNSQDLENSAAFVSVVGNDFAYYISQHGVDPSDIINYAVVVIAQLAHNVKRVHKIGVKQVLVTGLPPIGCLPRSIENNTCNSQYNVLSGDIYNDLWNTTVNQMNVNESQIRATDYTPYIYLDLYNPLYNIVTGITSPPSGKPLDNPMEACCTGMTDDYYCASVATNGTKMYTLCENPETKLFWDRSHPSHRGWSEVIYLLRDTFSQLQIPHKK
ncbi:hypothetical protein Drorol1_Dr00026306 [Drosera rotundifolia]